MGTVITPESDEGEQIRRVAEYLFEIGLTAEGENIHQYLEDGNFAIAGWLVGFIGAAGFTPLPDTGSGTTIYIRRIMFLSGDFSDPTRDAFTRAFLLLTVLLHEKFHAERQGLVDRLWYLVMLGDSLLFWWLDSYNPMETAAFKFEVTTLDKMIDIKINNAIRMSYENPLLSHHIDSIKRLMDEVEVIIDIKQFRVETHNNAFRPDIPIGKLYEAMRKVSALVLRLPPQISPQQFHTDANDVLLTLNQFEAEMNST